MPINIPVTPASIGAVPITRDLIPGTNVTLNGGVTAVPLSSDVTIAASGGGGGLSNVPVDQNGTLVVNATSLNFTGAGVAVTNTGAQANIAISGGGGSSFRGCLVNKSVDQTNADYSTAPVVTWDAEQYDTSNIHDNVTNPSRLTVPAGVSYIRLSGGVYTSNVNGASNLGLFFGKNGVFPFQGWGANQGQTGATNTPYLYAASAIIPVIAGDYFEMHIYCLDSSITVAAIGSWAAMEIIA